MYRAGSQIGFVLCFLALAPVDAAFAHGSVTADEDLCRIKIGYFAAHFKIYLPATRRHEQFCEDLPETGHSVFVMEYEHRQLEQTPLEFRIIRNVTGKGRFTRAEDLAHLGNLEEVTVFHQPQAVQPDVFTVQHRFAEGGEFVGIVTATQPATGQVYSAVFPFAVGFTGFGYWPWLAAALLLLQGHYWWLSRRRRRRKPTLAVVRTALLLAVALPASNDAVAANNDGDGTWLSQGGRYRVSYTSRLEPIVPNRMHSWVLHIESTADGTGVDDAEITVDGGMPEHDHGLPTRPAVTGNLGEGDYLLQGMRFHMNGSWEVRITIDSGSGRDTAVIPIEL